MPRYVVERTFVDPLDIPVDAAGAERTASVAAVNAALGVTWIHSYVAHGGGKSFCVYDAPAPDAIREAARRNGLPVDDITEVSVLDPYFYRGAGA